MMKCIRLQNSDYILCLNLTTDELCYKDLFENPITFTTRQGEKISGELKKMLIELIRAFPAPVSYSHLFRLIKNDYSSTEYSTDDIRKRLSRQKVRLPAELGDNIAVNSVAMNYRLLGENYVLNRQHADAFASNKDTDSISPDLHSISGRYVGYYIDPLGHRKFYSTPVFNSLFYINAEQGKVYAIYNIRYPEVLDFDFKHFINFNTDSIVDAYDAYLETKLPIRNDGKKTHKLTDSEIKHNEEIRAKIKNCILAEGTVSFTNKNLMMIDLNVIGREETWKLMFHLNNYLESARYRHAEKYLGGLGLKLVLNSPRYGTYCQRLGLARDGHLKNDFLSDDTKNDLLNILKITDDSSQSMSKPLKLSSSLDQDFYRLMISDL